MKYIKLIYFFIIAIIAIPSQSQNRNRLNTEILTGLSLPIGSEISKLYGLGFTTEVRISKIVKNRFYIKPTISYNYFSNNPVDNYREELHFFNLGGSFQYIYFTKKNNRIYFGPSLMATYYSSNSTYKTISKHRYPIFSNFLLTYDARVGYQFKSFIIEIIYNPIRSTPHLDDAFIDKLDGDDELYQLYEVSVKKFNFSKMTFNFGIIF